jgi:hypothetical protein
LSLHVDAVFADKSHTSLSAGHTALTGSLSIVGRVGGIKLVGFACFSHFWCMY